MFGISVVWTQFYEGTGRKLKSGRTSYVWWDLCTPLDERLINLVDKNFHLLNPSAKFPNFVLDNGD